MKEKLHSLGWLISKWNMPGTVRRLLASWLTAAAVLYGLLPAPLKALQGVEGLEAMSFPLLLMVAASVFLALTLAGQRLAAAKMERWLMTAACALLFALARGVNDSALFLRGGLLVLALLGVYAVFGWDGSEAALTRDKGNDRPAALAAAVFAFGFFLFLKDWTVGRYQSFSNAGFDFGVFSQAFHYLRTTLIPYTTLERDGLLSHFAVHVSPILYTILPVYALFPRPETLQIVQAALMASAAVPAWKLGRHYGFPGILRLIFCLLLFCYPAYGGGVSYDFHENCFLTPLLLWMFYGIERKNTWLTILSAVLVLMVKEDAAVYIAVAGLWLLASAGMKGRDCGWKGKTGLCLLAASLVWFWLVTGYLSAYGDGVMTWRYRNFFFGGSESMMTAVKAVLLSPMKALYECMDEEKMKYLHLTMLALGWLPLLTRRYERFVLLIPYVLINLLSDYRYQHDILFQYSFGSAAFMLYLAMVNYSDLRRKGENWGILLVTALVLGAMLFGEYVHPEGERYKELCETYEESYQVRREGLKQIPEDASVAATTYLIPHLSQRDVLYDIRYCTREQMLSTEYVLIDPQVAGCLKNYESEGVTGYEGITRLLESQGYVLLDKVSAKLEIYQKQ